MNVVVGNIAAGKQTCVYIEAESLHLDPQA